MRPTEALPVVRAQGQFGPPLAYPHPFRVFLDDARNPPLAERNWVVVRTVADGIDLLERHNDYVTEVSLDNDLNSPYEGHHLLDYLLRNRSFFGALKKITIHTGNDPKARLMRKMLRGSGLEIKRRIPSTRIYPNSKTDKRLVIPYVRKVSK